MNTQDITLSRCFSEGWEAFKRNIGLAIGIDLLAGLLIVAASQVPLGNVLALFPIVGACRLFFLALLKGLNPSISTLFAGFSSVDNWARWLGVGWLLWLYEMATLLVSVIIGAIFIVPGILMICSHFFLPAGIALIVLGCLTTLAAYYAVAVRWVFVFYAGAEGATAFDAIRVSTQLTEGIRWRLFWIIVALGLFNLAGMLVCCLGTIFTDPIVECTLAALYLDVRQAKTRQAEG
jgi:uncharacterized membrane protein